MKIIVEQAVTGIIQERDLAALDLTVVRKLSGPAHVEFTIPYTGQDVQPIQWKPYGQLVHIEETIAGEQQIIASCLTTPSSALDQQGNMKIVCDGFTSYAKGIPWLDNYNPITVDPFQIVARIWNHLQTQPQGNLNVTVTPASSGTFLLPGFGFDGTNFVVNFFAIFVREIDFRDCADEMNNWARDIPFEYAEISEWNSDHTAINKSLVLAYPRRGVRRTELAFRIGENVIAAVEAPEVAIASVSEVIIRGWFPGTVYNGQFTNTDTTRFRRVMMQDDASINTQERAAAAAQRLLTRNLVPPSWNKISIDGAHSNAPFGTFDVGDDIFIQGWMNWQGDVQEWHRIVDYTIDDKTGHIDLTVAHVDTFNYLPVSLLQDGSP